MEEEEEMKDTPKKQRRKRKLRQDESPELPSPTKSEEEKVEVEVPKKKRGRKKKIVEPPPSEPEEEEEDSDLQKVFRLVENLMASTAAEAFLQRPDDSKYGMSDYYDIITKPMWLKEVERKYKADKYSTVTELVADFRLMLENCYHYWGPSDTLSKRALKLEQMFENKLNSLPEDLQDQCSLEATHGEMVKDEPDDSPTKKANNKKGGFNSKLLNWVINGRDGEKSDNSLRSLENMTKVERTEAEKQLTLWETEHLLTSGVLEQIASMWEFPVIGQFVHLVYNVLNIDTISQMELERMLLMPQASKTLATLMTSMLIPPFFRAKLEAGPAMPYSIWTRRLNVKVASWYRNYRSKGDSTIEVFDSLGVEPQFWMVLGEENPLKDYAFHELTFLQRVWLLKALCDFLLHNHKKIQDCINNLEMVELREQNLGMDKNGYSYHYFPMFKEVRIYKMAKVLDTKWKGYEGGVEEAMTKCAEDVDEDDPSAEQNLIGYSRRPLHKPPRSMRPSHKDFKLVCKSLADVRSLIERFCDADPSLRLGQGPGARLVTRLQAIVSQLESRESKMELGEFIVRSRMKDEWTRHKERSASFVDPGIAYWERKEKEEKRAVEEKEVELGVPGTSQDLSTDDEKRERRSRRESSLKMLLRDENGLIGEDSEEESPLDFDDNSEDEWFATKKDKENKKKKRCMSAKKLKKQSNFGEKNQHSTPSKDLDKLILHSSSNNVSVKAKGASEPLVQVKEEPCDPDETSSQLFKGNNSKQQVKSTPLFQGSSNLKDTHSINKGEPIVCKQEVIDEPQTPSISSIQSTSVIQSLVRPVSNVKLEKAGKTAPITPNLSNVKRSNSPESEVVYISDSEDSPDIKPNPALLAKQLSSNKVETINYSMNILQQGVGNYLIPNTVQNQAQAGNYLIPNAIQNQAQFVPVNVTPGDQVLNPQPQVFNMAQQPSQQIPYQIPPAQNIVQQPVIRPNPGIVRLQGQPRPNLSPNQKFVVLQNNANNNAANQFMNKNPRAPGSNFPTTPTMQTVNWFGPRGSPRSNVNYSPRQRGSPRGRGSPLTPTRGSPRFSGRTPPNAVRTPGSMVRTPSQLGARTPSPMRGRGSVPSIRPGPVRNLNFNRSPAKPVNKPPSRDLPTNDTPDIEGTLVVSLTDSGGFGYAVMLADGGKISLTQDQLAKIRSDNGGTLPKTCKVPLNMQNDGFRID